ncbi:transporter substrate-binding domain-containing protein [Ancylobacter sp. 6x-1]|uniref:Transporter substrate-binding domain-containing protein n=1 Tax=Ancylobacter crimeensis TaxID=2579147 RepID=A0ABT0D935_9HYPH|nr:transporter substrate-binding domain-containing protein [Ancylobacter crimeensis]MCK0196461.1 transporter substrate-binding domain-containing protein [Ancylobacter crimeensis]
MRYSGRFSKQCGAFAATAVLFLLAFAVPPSRGAETAAKPGATRITLPGFFDPRRRPDRPDPSRALIQIRFIATDDFPPFSFRGADGQVMGFDVDLARAICQELAVQCTLEVKPFDALIPALEDGQADAAVAGIAMTPASRAKLDFSDRYFRSPARFLARRERGIGAITPETIGPLAVGVVAGTAHEAYLKSFFPNAALRPYPNMDALRAALLRGEVELVFADGVQSALWMNSAAAQGCCAFVGGPFTESRYFGEGLAIAVKSGNDLVRQSINYALSQLWEKGLYTDLYLRWFPISVY